MTDVTTRALMEELVKEDEQMLSADENYQQARMRAQLALRRYSAVRDYVTERLGESPYRAPENGIIHDVLPHGNPCGNRTHVCLWGLG